MQIVSDFKYKFEN